MAKMRVHELAKEFGMTSKELLKRLEEMKIPAKNHASTLVDAYVDKIRKALGPEIAARAEQIRKQEEEEAARREAAERERQEEEQRKNAADVAAERESRRRELAARKADTPGDEVHVESEVADEPAVAEEDTGRVLGAQLMCARATDMIGEFTEAVANRLTVKQMADVVHPHPTYSEGIIEVLRLFEQY